MIIKPYSEIATEDFSAAAFPCVKHFFKCDEAAGATTFTDSVGGVAFPLTGAITTPVANAVHLPVAQQTGTGAFSAPGTKKLVIFIVAQWHAAASYAMLGVNTSGDYIQIVGDAATDSVIYDVSNSGTNNGSVTCGAFTLLTAATTYGRALVVSGWNAAGGLTPYEFSTASAVTGTPVNTTESVALAGDQVDALDQVSTKLFITGANTNVFGLAWMEFTTLPSDLVAGLAWMTAEWGAGNKAIYPAWKALS